jgi:pre-rRNA-processing protein TSR4
MDGAGGASADDAGSVASSASSTSPSIELGFAERVPAGDPDGIAIESAALADWDGGKLGGRPTWLDPAGLPPPEALACGRCARPLALLAQLYAPLDEADVGHAGAFHRMLYVFSCVRGECVNRAPGDESGDGASAARHRAAVVALRCQLPATNPHHAGGRVVAPPPPVCALCGAPAPHRCSRCRGPRYCSRDHQAAHWRAGHKAACGGAPADAAATVDEGVAVAAGCAFPAHELVIEREPSDAVRREREAASLPAASATALRQLREGGSDGAAAALASAAAAAAASSGDDGEVDESQLSIDDLTQKALAETTGARLFADDVMRYFQRRVAAEPAQVVRYCRWPEPEAARAPAAAASAAAAVDGEGSNVDDEELEVDADGEPFGAPLWLTGAHQPPAGSPPPCGRCGAPRRFEFQLMPQLLNYVNTAPQGSGGGGSGVDLDFGTLAVYTCTRSCSADSGAPSEAAAGGAAASPSSSSSSYVPEYVWVQPLRDEDEAPVAEGGQPGAAAGGGGSRGSILHEALRRLQEKQPGKGAAPAIAEGDEDVD